MKTMVSPSLLSANFIDLKSDVEMINKSEADWLHMDIMDGVFVPNISFGFPVLEAVAKIVSDDNREWEGSPTELAQVIQTDMAVNRLTKHLNVNASRLLEEHQVKYENKTKHAGRRIRLTYMVVEAPAFEVIE